MEVIRREAMQSRRANCRAVGVANERSLIPGSCLRLRRLHQPGASDYARVTGSCIMAQMKPTSSRATAAITSDFGFCRAQRR